MKYLKFKEVSIGQKFIFSSEFEFPFSGMKRGTCIKLSSRKYQFIEDKMNCRVGSVNTTVIPVKD